MIDFYPDVLVISGKEYKAQISTATGMVLLPYKDEPDVKQGDTITQKLDTKEIALIALDVSFRRIGTFASSNKTPHMLTMKVQLASESSGNMAASSEAPVVTDSEPVVVTIGLLEFVQKIAAFNDSEAKETLNKLLKNSTVNTLLGAGAASLIKILNT